MNFLLDISLISNKIHIALTSLNVFMLTKKKEESSIQKTQRRFPQLNITKRRFSPKTIVSYHNSSILLKYQSFNISKSILNWWIWWVRVQPKIHLPIKFIENVFNLINVRQTVPRVDGLGFKMLNSVNVPFKVFSLVFHRNNRQNSVATGFKFDIEFLSLTC